MCQNIAAIQAQQAHNPHANQMQSCIPQAWTSVPTDTTAWDLSI